MYKKIIVALFITWLLPFVITSFYNQPAIDDYWSANAINAYGKIGAVQYFYHTVSARYVSLFIMSVCNTLPDNQVWIFKVWPVLTIVCLFGAFYFFYRSFFKTTSSKSQAFLLTCLFVVLHIANMRSVFEGLYWMSSTVCYQVALCVFAVGTGAVIRDMRNPKLWTQIIAIICSLILPGTVEMIIPVYLFTLILLLYIAYRFGFPKATIVSCSLISLLLFLLVAFSKGSLSRVENDSLVYHQSLGIALWYAAKSIAYYSAIWLVNPLSISAFGVCLSSMPLLDGTGLNLVKKDRIILLCYFIASGLAVYVPLYLFESLLPFPRITTLFFFVFFHACLITVFFSYPIVFKAVKKIRVRVNKRAVQIAITVVLVVCAFTNKNFVLVSKDLLEGVSSKYDAESYQRYQVIRSCKSDTCLVPAHRYWPYFAQSSQKERSDDNYFEHMNVFFKKTILMK